MTTILIIFAVPIIIGLTAFGVIWYLLHIISEVFNNEKS
jgi:hypothetical protein